jgi:hypothetical protein
MLSALEKAGEREVGGSRLLLSIAIASTASLSSGSTLSIGPFYEQDNGHASSSMLQQEQARSGFLRH